MTMKTTDVREAMTTIIALAQDVLAGLNGAEPPENDDWIENPPRKPALSKVLALADRTLADGKLMTPKERETLTGIVKGIRDYKRKHPGPETNATDKQWATIYNRARREGFIE